MNLAQPANLPAILPLQKFSTDRVNDGAKLVSLSRLEWKKLSPPSEDKLVTFKCERRETRVNSFSELRSTWTFDNKQQIVTDMLASKGAESDFVYISGIKPISVTQLDTKSDQAVQVDLSGYFTSAWRMYFPRIRLLPLRNESSKVILYEETTNDLHLVDFAAKSVHVLESSPKEGDSMLGTAKKKLSKYFVDQNQTFRSFCVQNDTIVSFRFNSNSLKFTSLKHKVELNFSLNADDAAFKLSISHVTPLASNSILVVGYDASKTANSDQLKPSDLKYFVLNYPNFADEIIASGNIQSLGEMFKFSLIDKCLLASHDDFLLQQIEIRDAVTKEHEARPIPKAFKV